MSIWTKIFGWLTPKTIKIHDEFFGILTVEDGYFIGEKYFKPVNVSIALLVEGKKINAFQRDFFVELESRYASLLPIAKTEFENEFKNWKPDFEIKDFEQEFTLISIDIPDKEDAEWSLGFECIHDINHYFSIYFKQWNFLTIIIDG